MGWYPSNESDSGMVWVDEDLDAEEYNKIMTSPDYIERVMNASDEDIYASEEE